MLNKLSKEHWPIFILSSFSSLGNLFLAIILVRLLSPEDVGAYKIFFLHLSAIPFLFMAGGPIHSVLYWIGRDEHERKKYLNATWILTLSLSFLIFIVGFPIRNFLSEHLNIPVQYVVLMLITGSLWCPSGHYTEMTIASGGTAKGSVFDIVFEFIKTSGFILIAYHYRSLVGVFSFFGITLMLKLFISGFLNYKKNAISFDTDLAHIKKVFYYCLPISISGCLGFFVDKVDLLILSSQLETSAFAFYSMGCLIIPPLFLLEMSVQKILIPKLSQSYLQKDWRLSAKHFRKGISDIAFLIIPSIFGLCTFAKPIITILYTETYLNSVIYLQLFALSYIFLIFPHDSVPRASGQTKWILNTYLLITPISLFVVYVTANIFGAKGVLLVALLLKSIPKILGLIYSKSIMHWKWSEMFPTKKLLRYFLLSLVLSVTSILSRPFFYDDVWWFLISGSLFATIYLGSFHLQKKRVKYEFA